MALKRQGLRPSSCSSLGSLAWATRSCSCPALFGGPPLNWFGKELSSKMAPPVSLSHSHFLHSLI